MGLNIAVLGGGAWGSTLAELLLNSGHQVRLWRRRDGDEGLQALHSSELVVAAMALVGVTAVAERISHWTPRPVVSCSKGLDPASGATASGLWNRVCPNWPVLVLSGPNLATELQRGQPAASVLAGHDQELLAALQHQLSTDQLRLYRNNDPRGAEVAGGLKNVMAIAAGVCDGLGLGANARASLLTRALAEMALVIQQLGGRTETLYGLAGIGDLMATATSPLSRNYRFGLGLAEGLTGAEALSRIGATVEGIPTCEALCSLAQQHGWQLPIASTVLALVQAQLDPATALQQLMRRELRSE
ncbi:MAG: NAD(P)H-dependent glycerol-3-phosphate dehydrogenase [Synechococcus sp.]|nr:NAD(P)H-dependent glycerol-3-phosphate dehydrogenase [Synechococcus sp.]